MIIKSLSRRDASFGQLINYMTRKPDPRSLEQTVSYANQLAENLTNYIDRHNDDAASAITQNLGDLITHDSIVSAFKANAALLPKRKNGVTLYHEILSFNQADTPRLTPTAVEDLTRFYLSLRAPGAPAFARIHQDTDHTHVHIMLSANDLGSAKRNWMTRTQFNEIKQETEAYQRHKYPELAHSLAQPTHQQPERTRSRKPDGKLPRQQIADLVRRAITLASSQQQFERHLASQGFKLVQRGSTLTIINETTGQRARLKTLNLLDAFETAQIRWSELPAKLEALEAQHIEKQRDLWREQGFAARILATLQTLNKPLNRIGTRIARLRKAALNRFSGKDRYR